jgi:Sulfatase
LPIQPLKQRPITALDYRKVPPPRFAVTPPKGAPNAVIVLLDQVGYADPATFGGQIRTPTLDRLAKDGLTYTNFHVNSSNLLFGLMATREGRPRSPHMSRKF